MDTSCVQLLATVNNASVNLHGMVSGEHVLNPLATDERMPYGFLVKILLLNVPCFMWRWFSFLSWWPEPEAFLSGWCIPGAGEELWGWTPSLASWPERFFVLKLPCGPRAETWRCVTSLGPPWGGQPIQ